MGIGSLLFLSCAAACAAWADDFHFESAGARFGLGAEGPVSQFHQAEAFAVWDLPWAWNLGHTFWLQSKLDTSAGWLGDSRSGAGILTGGPVLALGCGKSPVSLAFGWSPTFITDHEFSSRNLGNLYQFTSYIGFNVDILSRVRLGYRLQHMSNGGFAHPNPGLNMHLFGVSYLF
ncbi:MAG TPA: acyloxyacyl hydrolase [Verrucomicrobiae bacterium]|nr:acyloxyacyl hydrolase [Verrucomicrobiae bacterium]